MRRTTILLPEDLRREATKAAHQQGIQHVFGFDRHFLAAGFKVWPGEDI